MMYGITAQCVNALPLTLTKHRLYLRKQGNNIVLDFTDKNGALYRVNNNLEGALLFNDAQDLTEEEQYQALSNLGLLDIIDIIDQLNVGEGLSELNGSTP
jgi:hypothetical protein